MQRPRKELVSRETVLVLLLGGIAAWLWTMKLIVPAIAGPLVDYGKHYDSAYLVLANMRIVGVADGYYYPTFLALIHQPLFWFDASASAIAWSLANLVLVLAGSMVLANLMRQTPVIDSGSQRLDLIRHFIHDHSLVVVLLAVGAFEPLQRVLRSGNVDPLNFFLASMLLALLATRRDWRAGIVAGIFCLVKIVPILLIPVLIVTKRWRTLAAMVGMLFAYVAWLLATGWWREDAYLFREVLPGVPWIWQNISLSVHRLAATLFAPSLLEQAAPYAALILSMNVVMGLSYCALLLLAMRRGIVHHDLLMAGGLVAILVFSPLLETIHFSWILPAFAIQTRAWIGGRISDSTFAVLVIAWMGLTAADSLSAIVQTAAPNVFGWMVQTVLYLFLMAVSLWVGLARSSMPADAVSANAAEPETANA